MNAKTPATRTRVPARDIRPGDVMRYMSRPAHVIGVSNVWTRGNHSYVTLTFIDEGELETEAFFADKERTLISR